MPGLFCVLVVMLATLKAPKILAPTLCSKAVVAGGVIPLKGALFARVKPESVCVPVVLVVYFITSKFFSGT